MRPKITQLTPMKPDLHTHTTASDGLLTPAELVALADKHRVTLLAVTDHDTFDGAAQLLGKPTPMPILQGVELSLRDMPGLHLLGYGRGTDTPLHRKVRALSQMRLGRARQMVEKLNARWSATAMWWTRARRLTAFWRMAHRRMWRGSA